MTPTTLATLKIGQAVVDTTGALYHVTTTPSTDAKGNPYCFARSGGLVARISVSDCGHFEPYRVKRSRRKAVA